MLEGNALERNSLRDNIIKELGRAILKELGIISMFIFFVAVILTIVFSQTQTSTLVKFMFGMLWFAVLPGYCVMLPWRTSISLGERTVIGTLVILGVFGVISYYLGLLGIRIQYHTILLPFFVIVGTAVCLFIQQLKDNQQAKEEASSSKKGVTNEST